MVYKNYKYESDKNERGKITSKHQKIAIDASKNKVWLKSDFWKIKGLKFHDIRPRINYPDDIPNDYRAVKRFNYLF